MLIDLSTDSVLDPAQVGGKAFNLAFMYSHGLPVPRAIVIPYYVETSEQQFAELLFAHSLFNHPLALYAVRSSGVGEDSKNNSYAGMFDTFLNVPSNEVIPRINDVRKSVLSLRGKQYSTHRGIAINNMSVVVQEMVDAQYAGVAFSVSPIENDARIMLIEIVPGLGESLVSGKTTPTSVRYNKLTKQHRIQQAGTRPIPDSEVIKLLNELLPLVNEVEAIYKHSVDIEWAYSNGLIQILQARPITT